MVISSCFYLLSLGWSDVCVGATERKIGQRIKIRISVKAEGAETRRREGLLMLGTSSLFLLLSFLFSSTFLLFSVLCLGALGGLGIGKFIK